MKDKLKKLIEGNQLADFFQECEKLEIPSHQMPVYSQFKQQFMHGIAAQDFMFNARLATFVNNLFRNGDLKLKAGYDIKETNNGGTTVENEIAYQNNQIASGIQNLKNQIKDFEKAIEEKSAMTDELEWRRLVDLGQKIKSINMSAANLGEKMELDPIEEGIKEPVKANKLLTSIEQKNLNTSYIDWLTEKWSNTQVYIETLEEVFAELYSSTQIEIDKFKEFTNFYREQSLENYENLFKSAPLFKQYMTSQEYELFDEIMDLLNIEMQKAKTKPANVQKIIFKSYIKMQRALQNKLEAFYKILQGK
jgi:MarR-like DNA-binding transcriptional regulator SgrR of sgrS sRNA